MKRVALVSCTLCFTFGCDGYIKATGSLRTISGTPVAGCQARLETLDGYVVEDWHPVSQQLDLAAVVAPGRDTYLAIIACPGYLPALTRIESGMPPKDLGELTLKPIAGPGS